MSRPFSPYGKQDSPTTEKSIVTMTKLLASEPEKYVPMSVVHPSDAPNE